MSPLRLSKSFFVGLQLFALAALAGCGGGEPTTPKGAPGYDFPWETESFSLKINEARLQPREDFVVVEILAQVENFTPAKLELAAPSLTVTTGRGAVLDRYYVAFDPAPVVAAEDTALVHLKYRMSREQLDQSLQLVWLEQSMTLKAPGAVDLPPAAGDDAGEPPAPATFTTPAWGNADGDSEAQPAS